MPSLLRQQKGIWPVKPLVLMLQYASKTLVLAVNVSEWRTA